MELREVRPDDDAALAAWFAVVHACAERAFPGQAHGTLEEARALHRSRAAPDAPVRSVLCGVWDNGTCVGALQVDLPQHDNRHRADLQLLVHPQHRRRGAGSLLLQEAIRTATAAGRSTLLGDVDLPVERAPGHAFAERAGAVLGLVEVRRALALPVDDALLDRLEEQARAASAGYEVRTWVHAVPEDLLDERALLEQRMSTDAPLGALDLREEAWDGARVRGVEAEQRDLGRTVLSAGAVRDGRLVAFSDIGVLDSEPELAHQWNTLVLREHRGRRLGLLVKLAGLRLLARRVPQARRVVTWNAKDNAPMIAVNEALGFRVDGGSSSWSLVLG